MRGDIANIWSKLEEERKKKIEDRKVLLKKLLIRELKCCQNQIHTRNKKDILKPSWNIKGLTFVGMLAVY